MSISLSEGAQQKALTEAYRPLVISCARRYAGRGAEFEDLVQEGYVALLELAPQCPDPQWLPSYLKSRLPGRVRDAARKNWRRYGSLPIDEIEPEQEPQAAEQGADTVETEDLLERHLKEQDAALVRLLMQGYTQAELAQKSGVSQQAISLRLSRIRKSLMPLIAG